MSISAQYDFHPIYTHERFKKIKVVDTLYAPTLLVLGS